MFGMEMMLKSLGIEPEEIKQSVAQFGQVVLDMNARLERIEHKLDALCVQGVLGASETKDINHE